MFSIIGKIITNPSRAIPILFFIWAALQLILFLHYGVNTSVDSSMYQDNAAALLNGTFPQGRDIWYISYSIFLACVSLVGSDDLTVFIQVLLTGAALFLLYRVTLKITGSEITALLTGICYLAWIKIHQWNFYIYTESLFTSFSIIFFAGLVLSRTPTHYVITFFIFLFTFFLRPTGFAWLVAALAYGVAHEYHRLSKKVWIATIFVGAIVTFLIANNMMRDYDFIDSYRKAELIYPNITLGLHPPDNLIIPDEDHSPLVSLVLFICSNPIYFFKITVLKLFLFLANVKPYFSYTHNVLIVGFLFPLYFFAIKGFQQFIPNRKEQYFIAAFVMMQCAMVSMTTENWDGRFLIPILPFVFMLSAVGIIHSLRIDHIDKANQVK